MTIRNKKIVWYLGGIALGLLVLTGFYILFPAMQSRGITIDVSNRAKGSSPDINLSTSLPSVRKLENRSTYLPEEKSLFGSRREWKLSRPRNVNPPELPQVDLPAPLVFFPFPVQTNAWKPMYSELNPGDALDRSIMERINEFVRDQIESASDASDQNESGSLLFSLGDLLVQNRETDRWTYGIHLLSTADRVWLQAFPDGTIRSVNLETHRVFALKPRESMCCGTIPMADEITDGKILSPSRISSLPEDLQDIARIHRDWFLGERRDARKRSDDTWLPQESDIGLTSFWNAYRLLRSRFLLADQSLQEAANLLIEGLKAQPSNPFLSYNLGLLMRKSNQKRRSKTLIDQYNRYYDNSESRPVNRRFLSPYRNGRERLTQGNNSAQTISQARKQFRNSLSQNRSFIPARLGVVYTSLMKDRPQEALEALKVRYPEGVQKRLLESYAQLRLENYKEAFSGLPTTSPESKQWKGFYLSIKGFLQGMLHNFVAAQKTLREATKNSYYSDYAENISTVFQDVSKERVFIDRFRRKYPPAPPEVIGREWTTRSRSPGVSIHLQKTGQVKVSGFFSSSNQYAWMAQPVDPAGFLSATFSGRIEKPAPDYVVRENDKRAGMMVGVGMYQFPSGKKESWGVRIGTTLENNIFVDQNELTSPLDGSRGGKKSEGKVWGESGEFTFTLRREQGESGWNWQAILNGERIDLSNVPISAEEGSGRTNVYLFVSVPKEGDFDLRLEEFELIHRKLR